KRGDEVKVEAMPFVAEDAPEPAKPGLLGLPVEKSDVMRLAEIALFGLVGVVALLTVLRPMVVRLTTLAPASLADGGGGLLAGAPVNGAAAAGRGTLGQVPGAALAGPAPSGLLEDESMVSLAQIEGQMRASSVRRVADLVERHPDETLTVVRGWIGREAG
ncbi:MAG: hypothetical protein JO143_01665, partial [Acetobacteraceae bacterium]|nr:hypothetical protein [Acetobacteraceae bacterium]